MLVVVVVVEALHFIRLELVALAVAGLVALVGRELQTEVAVVAVVVVAVAGLVALVL
jgi:hypothetical protein